MKEVTYVERPQQIHPKSRSFTVITPHLGDIQYLRECMASVEAQSYRNFEHLIVFDGPDKFNANAAIERSLYLLKNKGPGAARNFGGDACTSDWIVFLDSDDLLHPGFLEASAKYIQSNPEINIFRGVGWNLGGKRNGMRSSNFFFPVKTLAFAAANVIGGPTGIVVRREYFASNSFEEKMTFFEDWEYYVRVLFSGEIIGYCGQAKFHYRISDTQLTNFNKTKQAQVLSDLNFFWNRFGYRMGFLSRNILLNALKFRAYRIFKDPRAVFYLVKYILFFPIYPFLEVRRKMHASCHRKHQQD